jgi:hypothetical protein
MLIQYSTLFLASQLLIAVADDVPKFNIERGCKADNTTGSNLNTGLDESTRKCVQDEQQALNQLQSLWLQVAPSDRAMCTQETTDVSDVPPSYVELLTCLQGQQLAKKLKD